MLSHIFYITRSVVLPCDEELQVPNCCAQCIFCYTKNNQPNRMVG